MAGMSKAAQDLLRSLARPTARLYEARDGKRVAVLGQPGDGRRVSASAYAALKSAGYIRPTGVNGHEAISAKGAACLASL